MKNLIFQVFPNDGATEVFFLRLIAAKDVLYVMDTCPLDSMVAS